MSTFTETWPDADYASRWNVNYEDEITVSAAANQLAVVHPDTATAPHLRLRTDPTLPAFAVDAALTFYLDTPADTDVAIVPAAIELRLDGPYINVRSTHNLATTPAENVEIFLVSLDADTDYGIWDMDPTQQWYRVARIAADTIEFSRAADPEGTWETLLTATVNPADIPEDASSRLEVDTYRSGAHSADYTATFGAITYETPDAGPAAASGALAGVLPAVTGALLGGEVAGNLDATWDPVNARVVLTATEVLGRTAWITRRTGASRLRAVEVRGSRRVDPPSGFVVHDLEYTPGVETFYRLELRP